MPRSDQRASTSSTGTTAARSRSPQRGQVEVGPARVVEDRLEDRRGTRQHRDPLVADPLQDHVHIEHRLGHHRGPGHQAGQDPGLVAEGVEERVDDQ